MKGRQDTPRDNFTPALEAIGNLLQNELNQVFLGGEMAAMGANAEIESAALINHKRGAFYRHYLPLLKNLVSVLAESYKRYFKLALAHPNQVGGDPHQWTWGQLQPALGAALEWIRDWYVLACDGENQHVQHIASTEVVPGQTVSLSLPLNIPVSPTPRSWRAPCWLFAVSLEYGIWPLKTKNVPATDAEERLGVAHTRLLLKGARRMFLWELLAAMETVRNEELAAAGAIPAETIAVEAGGSNRVPKHWLKGVEGLTRKADLSRYTHNLTDRQRLAFSLKYEYGLGSTESASRMGIDRKTLSEHLEAANRKIEGDRSFEKRRMNLSKNSPDE